MVKIKPLDLKKISLEDLPRLRLKQIKLKKPLSIVLSKGEYHVKTRGNKTIITRKKSSSSKTSRTKSSKNVSSKKSSISRKTTTSRSKTSSKSTSTKTSTINVEASSLLARKVSRIGIEINKSKKIGYVTVDNKRYPVYFDGDDYFIVRTPNTLYYVKRDGKSGCYTTGSSIPAYSYYYIDRLENYVKRLKPSKSGSGGSSRGKFDYKPI